MAFLPPAHIPYQLCRKLPEPSQAPLPAARVPCASSSPRFMHPNPSPPWLTEQQLPSPSGAPVTPTLGASAGTARAICSTRGSKPAGHCLPGPPQEGCTSSKTRSPSQLGPILPTGEESVHIPKTQQQGLLLLKKTPAGELALPGLYRRMGQAGYCTLGTWSPPGMGRSEPAGEPGSGHGAAPFPGASNPPLAAPLGLAEQQPHFPLLEQEYGAAPQTLVLPAVPPTLHTPPWAAPPAPLTFLVNLVVLISTNAAVTAFR